MFSIRNMLISKVFQITCVIFISTIVLLNIAFYFFSNHQYQKEIERQYRSLYSMIAHLTTEGDLHTLEVYLEHYTHTNDVTMHFKDMLESSVFSNDTSNHLTRFEEVYYEDSLMGYLAVDYESSSLGREILYGYIGLNAISITLFAAGMIALYGYLKKESIRIGHDLAQIGEKHARFSFKETKHIHAQLLMSHEQEERQRAIFESHIKSLAHDIKTPLSVIRIYTDAWISGQLPLSSELLSDMKEEVEKISDIIPKFIELDYVQIPYEQDISVYIGKYVKRYQEVFESKHMSIESRLETLRIKISDHDLERLTEQLVFNAFYYSHPYSTVKISVIHESQTLSVEDQGIGMSAETIENIFKGPYRSKEAIAHYEKGSGIGLQMVREIVGKLGARIHIESILNHGTKVTIHFHQPDESLSARNLSGSA